MNMNKVVVGGYLQIGGAAAGIVGVVIGLKHPAIPICFAIGAALYLAGRYFRGQRLF